MGHSGADQNFQIDRTIDRGIRKPRHLSFLGELGYNVLQPFMAAPIRPGETIAGMSYNINAWVRSMFNLSQRPFVAAEVGYWLIPLTALDEFFVDLVVGTGRDVMERSVESQSTGRAARVAGNPVSGQGHLTPGLQHKARQWAGEIGGQSGDNGLTGSEYAPYVSHAVWKVAQDWYDMQLNGSAYYENPALYDNPPQIQSYIRGASISSFTASTDAVDPDPSGNSELSDLLEGLFLLTREEKTYAEYLARHGIDPRRAAGIAQPVALEHFNFTPMGSPQVIAGFTARDDFSLNAPVGTDEANTYGGFDELGTGDVQYHFDRGFYGAYGASRQGYRTRNLLVTEPSILVGTMAAWKEQGSAVRYSHIFDMTRMTHPGHWGDRGIGGVEEEDFLAVQDFYTTDGATLQGGASSDQTGDEQVMNLLHLYLHGEVNNVGRNNNVTDGLDTFQIREPGGDSYDATNKDINGHIQTQLHILSDLVA